MSDKKPRSKNLIDAVDDQEKQISSIYSVNGKYRAELTHNPDGWLCRIWSLTVARRERPVLANIQPYSSKQEAIRMAQECFAQYTGDDRYIAEADIMKENKSK